MTADSYRLVSLVHLAKDGGGTLSLSAWTIADDSSDIATITPKIAP
jgi:hypothetical protein